MTLNLPLDNFSKLEHELLTFFAKHREVYFVNLGTIKIVFNSAIVYKDRITPPFYSLIWTDDIQSVNGKRLMQLLIKDVAKSMDIGEKDAKQLIENYSSTIKKNLDQQQIHHIKDIVAIRISHGVHYLEYTLSDVLPVFQEITKSPLAIYRPNITGNQAPKKKSITSSTNIPTAPPHPQQSFQSRTPLTHHRHKANYTNTPPTKTKKTAHHNWFLYVAIIAVVAIAALIIFTRICESVKRNSPPLGSLY